MRRFVFAALIAALAACPAYAHSPSAISIKAEEGKVIVSVSHPVSDPIEHFIKLVTVSVNGKEIERREFTTQNAEGLEAAFEVPDLRSGDKISVFAVCNRFGDKRADMTAP